MNRLPKLEGSEKQVAWAEKIRAKMITKLIEDPRFTGGMDGLLKAIENREDPKEGGYWMKLAIFETISSKWIDRKDEPGIITITRKLHKGEL